MLLWYSVSCGVRVCHVIIYHGMVCPDTLCDGMIYAYDMLCYGMVWYVILCYAMSWFGICCYAVVCCALACVVVSC